MRNDRPGHDPTRSRRAPLAGAATAAAVLLLTAATGCAGPAAAESGSGGERTASGQPVADRPGTEAGAARGAEPRMMVRSAADSRVALYAHLQGTLVVTPERCLAVAGAAGTAPTPIAWADGWSVRTENGTATV